MKKAGTIENTSLKEETQLPESVSEIVVRKSVFICGARIVILSLIFFAFLLFLFISFFLVEDTAVMLLIILIAILSTIAYTTMSIYVYYRWKMHTYSILPHAIVESKGVFIKYEKTFACHRIESVSLYRSLIGRMFDFGSIAMYDPFLKQTIRLLNVDHPEGLTEILKKIYVTEEESDSSSVHIEEKIFTDAVHEHIPQQPQKKSGN